MMNSFSLPPYTSGQFLFIPLIAIYILVVVACTIGKPVILAKKGYRAEILIATIVAIGVTFCRPIPILMFLVMLIAPKNISAAFSATE